jgi:hypothetical protein
MRQLLIQNSGALDRALTPPVDPTEGAVGKLCVFEVGAAQAHDIAAAAPSRFIFSIKRSDDVIERTNVLSLANIARVVKKAYVAPAKQVQTVTITGPASAAGNVTLKLQDTFSGREPYERYVYNAKVASGASATVVATALEAAINADSQAPVTVSRSAGVLTLTAKEFDSFLEGAFDPGNIDGSGNTGVSAAFAVTAFAVGSGSPAQLKDIAAYAPGNVGRYVQDDPILGRQADVASYVDDAGQYTQYTVLHETPFDRAINNAVRFQEITIAVDSDVTGSLDTFFGSKLVTR